MKKMWLFSLVLLLPSVQADTMSTISNVWNTILNEIGSLGFLGLSPDTAVVAFTRILIWILAFAIFFAVITGLSNIAPFRFFSRGQAGGIAAVIATITAIFLPAAVLLATGTGWATAMSLLIIGAPIVAIGLLLIYLPSDPCHWNFLKFLICLLLFWIVSAMKYHVGVLVS